MKESRSVQAMRKRYERLNAKLAKLGLISQGTILERIVVEEASAGRAKNTLGPYYQWTRKIKGKTITVHLAASQAKAFQRAIDNHRKMEKIIRQMRELSLQILYATTQGVKRRKSPS